MEFAYFFSVVRLPESTKGISDDDDGRELNVLYVPQEITEAIARGLTDGLFELAADRLKLGRVIGRGAFGEVHVAEAHGILDSPQWVTVAVKRLAGL